MSFFCPTCDDARTKCVFKTSQCPNCNTELDVSLTKEQQQQFRNALEEQGPVRGALQKHGVSIQTRAQLHGCLALLGNDTPYISMQHLLWTDLWHMDEVEKSLKRALSK